MTHAATAAQRLAGLRQRVQLANSQPGQESALSRLLARRRAQGLIDVQWPSNVRDLVHGTDADYERVNQKAKGDPDWDAEYARWKRFFQDNRDPGFFSASYETVEEVRRRQKRLAEWQERLKTKNIDTGPRVDVSKPEPLIDSSSFLSAAAGAAGILLLLSAVRR